MKRILAMIKAILIVLITAILMLYFSSASRPKKTELPNDTSNKVSGFYALEEDSIDVLFLGTSHTYYGFNPGILYKNTGLSSYVFAGECQPISVTYYYLEEAIKTQHPQLIVLDVFAMLPSSKGCQTDGIIKKNLEDFKFSENKKEALTLLEEDSLIQNLFDVTMYHNRWDELSIEDFLYPLKNHFNDNFGYTQGYPVDEPLYERQMFSSDEMQAIDEVYLEYLYKIFDAIEKNNMDLLVVKTPYYETYDEYKMTNYIFHEAQQRGFQTLNYNQKYEEMDFVFDYDGDVWHCNVRGAYKVTSMLSEFIKENYDLTTMNNVYREKYNNLYRKTVSAMLWTQANAEKYLEYMKDFDITILVNYRRKDYKIMTEYQESLLRNLGLNWESPYTNYNAVVRNNELVFSTTRNDDFEEHISLPLLDIKCTQLDDSTYYLVNGVEYVLNYPGINMIIIDNETLQLVDILCFDTIGSFQILR